MSCMTPEQRIRETSMRRRARRGRTEGEEGLDVGGAVDVALDLVHEVEDLALVALLVPAAEVLGETGVNIQTTPDESGCNEPGKRPQ